MVMLPLEGIRVVSLTVVWAGPFATMILGDLGAEVICVESIQHFPAVSRGTFARPPEFIVPTIGERTAMGGQGGYMTYLDHEAGERAWERVVFWNNMSRNKLSCCIDLRRPEGLEVFKRLIKVSDVFVENNGAGAMEKLGITYEVLKEVKEDIIYITMPGLGQTGPHKDFKGFGAQLESLSGHTWLRGYPDLDPTRTSPYMFHCDASAGASAAFAAIAALHHRDKTGKGQYIELSQMETIIPHLAESIMDYTMNERVQTTLGNRHPWMAPHGCYRCRGEDRWVVIAVSSEEEWQGLCRAMGNPDWTKEERFADALSRYNNQDELDRLIEEWTVRHDHYEIMHILQKEGVPAGPVIDDRDAYHDPQLTARGFFEAVTHPVCGTHLYPGILWKMQKTPLSIRRAAPTLGQHNDYVFKQVIGMSDEEIAELEKEQIVGGDTYL